MIQFAGALEREAVFICEIGQLSVALSPRGAADVTTQEQTWYVTTLPPPQELVKKNHICPFLLLKLLECY